MKVPLCTYCRHFRPTSEGAFCAAFPGGDGIPDAILYDDELHFDPYPGDHGIQFDPTDEDTAQFVERSFGRRYTAGPVTSR